MKKSKILAMLMLVAVFASAFSVATITNSPAQLAVGSSAPDVVTDDPVFHPEAASDDKGIMAQLTTTVFTLDGNVSDWDAEGILPDTYGGITVYLAYDAANVYVAVIWADATVNSTASLWNKTDNADGFEVKDGCDDVVTIGFTDGYTNDFMTWTASNRTYQNYAFEYNGTSHAPDAGLLPYEKNSFFGNFNATDYPIYDNSWTTIVDNSTIPVHTKIVGWQPDEMLPDGSQTDVTLGVNHTGTHHIVEFQRALDTGNPDDLVLDFTSTTLYFDVGVANGDNARDMFIATTSHRVAYTNLPADLTFDAVPALSTESLLLQGTAYDDYDNYQVQVWLDTWENTWGTPDIVTVNRITGAWSYLLLFNEYDMPLGTNNININLIAPYETNLNVNYTVEFDDINAPTIIGLKDIEASYPTGVPGDEGQVVVTVGLSDDYDNVNYLTAQIYSRVDDGVAFTSPMLQFFADTTTFNGNITIDPTLDFSIQHNYTYWIDAYDTSLNRVTSSVYTFFTAITIPVPGFGIIAGLFGVAIAVLFVKKLKK